MKDFLSLLPRKRLSILQEITKKITNCCIKNNSDFGLLAYGSTTYGFNPYAYGKLNDVDLFLVIEEKTKVKNLISSLKNVFGDSLEVQFEHIQKVIRKEWQMCRMYATFENIKVGFRIITYRKLNFLCSEKGMYKPFKNAALLGYSRILVDKEWSYKTRRYVRTVLNNETVKLNNKTITITEQYLFSQKHHLGVFGRKLLVSHVLYDPFNQIQKCLDFTLNKHVEFSLKHDSLISTDVIISSMVRSERFSAKFKKLLFKRIEQVRKNFSK